MSENNYNNTVGTIIDYKALYQFLKYESLFFSNHQIIIDAPCGTGLLFEAAIGSNQQFIGIDFSKKQLTQVKNDVYVIDSDIFYLTDSLLPVSTKDAYLHCGFSFFNIFNSEKRKKLLQVFFNLQKVTSIGFEIQNKEFQDKNFEFNKWVENILPNNRKLKTRSHQISEDGYKLEMIFNENYKQIEILYYWTINECIRDCLDIGWKNIIIKPALYRKINNSHYYIELKR